MDRAVPSDTPPGLIAGRLEGISVPDLVWALCKRRKTGVLRIRRAGLEKALYLEGGRIIFASSGDRNDRLGEQLLRRGVISLDDLESAIERLAEGKRLGTLLVESKHLTPEGLVNGVIEQVKTIVLDQFAVDDGEYCFEEGGLPTEEVITLNIRTNQLLLEGIRRVRSLRRIRQSVGKPSTVYSLLDDLEDALDGIELSEGEQLLLERLKGGDASVEALCDEMYLSNFEIFQSLWVFRVLGVISVRDFPGLEVVESESEDDGSGFVEYLIRLCRARDTGVLYASCGNVDRSFHLHQGQCIFATSSDPDDGLLAFLLRRGVISLRDREETAKRLLSNKRVGTILRELGVIDDNDLQDMVRQQLAEVVCDTFRWDRADCRFIPGPLPSNEEITLELNPETLVTTGLRRVTSWARVQSGCGGVDSVLALTPDYLNLLDAMAGGEEEWEVVTALKTPRTPREICRLSKLGDFRVCQILWGLRVLGGIAILQEDVEDPARVEAEAMPEPEPEPAVEPVEAAHDDEPEIEQVAPGNETPVADEEPVVAAPTVRSDEPPAEEHTGQTSPIPKLTDDAPIDREPSLDEPDTGRSADSTVQLSREEIEAALSGPPEALELDVEEPEPEPAPADGEPSLWDVEQSTRTVRLSREEVEAALAAEPDSADWTPPEDLEQAISKFNAVQRVVYRSVRMELGAGAANFIKACCCGEQGADPLACSELLSDGSWDAEGLKQAIHELRIDDPWGEYQRVIEREVDLLREHIGDARAHDLLRRVQELDQAGATP